MIHLPQTTRELILTAAVFGLVLSVWLGVVLVAAMREIGRREKLQRRLGVIEGEGSRVLRLWHEGVEATTSVPTGGAAGLRQKLAGFSEATGWTLPIGLVIALVIGAAAMAGLLATALLHSIITGVSVAAVVVVGFWFVAQARITGRAALFERQLLDAMDLIGRSLRAGHPLLGAAQLVTQELEMPVSGVFSEIVQQQELGLSLEDAMHRAAARTPSEDMKLFSTSVSIQLRSGGNLADMIERLSHVIRERMRLGRRVRVLTTQTQFSKRVLLVLPLGMFVLLNLIKPTYMQPLYHTPMGHWMVGIAVVMLLIGSWVMNRMSRLQY